MLILWLIAAYTGSCLVIISLFILGPLPCCQETIIGRAHQLLSIQGPSAVRWDLNLFMPLCHSFGIEIDPSRHNSSFHCTHFAALLSWSILTQAMHLQISCEGVERKERGKGFAEAVCLLLPIKESTCPDLICCAPCSGVLHILQGVLWLSSTAICTYVAWVSAILSSFLLYSEIPSK